MKFKGNPLHRQGTSSKRDLIGGHIERWYGDHATTQTLSKKIKKEGVDALRFWEHDIKKHIHKCAGQVAKKLL